MGIKLDNISDADMDRVNESKNPPKYEAGDGLEGFDIGGDESEGEFNFDSVTDLDSIFDSGEGSSRGEFSENNPFGTQNNNGSQINKGLYGGNNNVGTAPVRETFGDRVANFASEGTEHVGRLFVEIVRSIKNRTADDLGYFSRNLIAADAIGLGAGVLLCIISAATSIKAIGIFGIGGTLLKSFALCCGVGMICIGVSAIAVKRAMAHGNTKISDMKEVGDEVQQGNTDEYMDSDDDIMRSLFGDDYSENDSDDDDIYGGDSGLFDGDEDDKDDDNIEIPIIPENNAKKEVDYDNELSNIRSNGIMNRRFLVETFTKFLPINNPDFSMRKDIPSDDPKFISFEANCLKALSNVLKCEIQDVKSVVKSVTETFFCFEIKMDRIKGMNKLADFERELEVYVRDDPKDESIAVSVTMIADYYKIVVNKGESPIVTLGDCMSQKESYNFFLDESNKLPMITGVTEDGTVVIDDAKVFDSMMIVGKQRSGKSWQVLNLMLSMMLFNTPEDVQFIIVDPKESNLFKTLALMPHVCGLHNKDQLLDVMDDIIDNEAPRRKKILSDNRCENIWDARKKGIRLPILYLFIDEYLTLVSSFPELTKDFDSRLKIIITQLPSLGIRPMFIVHRATGAVDKTNRAMIDYICAVRSVSSDVNEVMDLKGKGWTHPLVNPGDMALKTGNRTNTMFARGLAITTSDSENTRLMENVAKAFYKIGVDIPDMSTLKVAANRDEKDIRKRLMSDVRRVQYDNWETELED